MSTAPKLLQPKEIEIELPDGGSKTFYLGKYPAIAGREIVSQYPMSGLPKLGDYGKNEVIMKKMMRFVAVETSNGPVNLDADALIDNHAGDWETLARLEKASITYNCSFFQDGKASTFFEGLIQQGQALITKTLTDLLEQSSAQGKQSSGNSKKDTP